MAANHVHLRAMRRDDIPDGLRLCRQAGWNQVAADWEFFLESSPGGCRVATDAGGSVIGSVATISYGDAFSWISMMLVDVQHRRLGVGTQLLQEAIALLGDRTIARLDATPAGRDVYLPLGFREEYGLQRMVRETRRSLGKGGRPDPGVRRMSDSDFDDVMQRDRGVFGGDRRALLGMCRREAPEYAWTSNGGYLFGRHGHACEHIGPLVAPDETTARRLVSACLSAHGDRPVLIDVPLRASWIAWLESVGFTLQRPFTRMRRGPRRYSEQLEQIFAITGPEFG